VKAEGVAPAPAACPNCSTTLRAGDDFCGRCGQRVPRGRLRLRDLAGELWHALFGLDRSLLGLVRDLLVRPGEVARDWVEGRRKRYFGPFAFVLWMAGLGVLVIALTGFRAFTAAGGGHNDVADFLARHVNIVQLLQVPLLAGLARLFVRGTRNYAEQLVLASYTMGIRIGVLALVVVPGWFLWQPSASLATPITYAYVGAWIAYFAWASARFQPGRAWATSLRAAAAAAATHYLTAVAVLQLGRIWFALNG
jgi:hypothetical protein